MKNKHLYGLFSLLCLFVLLLSFTPAFGASEQFKGKIFDPGMLKPVDSKTSLKAGVKAPDFSLPSLSGNTVTLNEYKGKKIVVLSFVPAAWTPVCSDQWPGYNLLKEIFDRHNTILIGITVDNIPTLYAWTREMGTLWFP
ncbi:MAG: redoxin domain-containing protein, partial [Thermodesulfovibrionales bacterium]|nr:redoxin domain-containing protein [Thermodesulfovibrionales bacterium]